MKQNPATAPSLPMEHFTSNSGQMLKHCFGLPRTPQERQGTSCTLWQASEHAGSQIFYLSAVRWKIFRLETCLHAMFLLRYFLRKQFQTPGSQIPKYPLQSISPHNWLRLWRALKSGSSVLIFLREARAGQSQVNWGQSEQRIKFMCPLT